MFVTQTLRSSESAAPPTFSFEFSPPKDDKGRLALERTLQTLKAHNPSFIDVTWGAGGSHVDKGTNQAVEYTQSELGLDTCMHLTCTNMPLDEVDAALEWAYRIGCRNILALRGDAPKDQEKWTAVSGGFRYAKDLVLHIRKNYGDKFEIGVAGYPELCDDNDDNDLLVDHLKEKVDAGASFVVTQMFYHAGNFLSWVDKCRAKGITVPIIPGIMPIANFDSFKRRLKWARPTIPDGWFEQLEKAHEERTTPVVGCELVADLCRTLLNSGKITHLHFYTMNVAKPTERLLRELQLIPEEETASETAAEPAVVPVALAQVA